ncbi:MAG: hypothetical protein HOV97_05535 [Nonomuraea sp.]|nr:hypothetical protein [Nonomuraea sp.]
MTTTSIPTPSAVFAKRKAPALPPRPQIVAPISLDEPGTIVRPGMIEVLDDDLKHDGAVKAKHLKRGQRVRPLVHGEPRGSERVVGKVERIQGGAFVRITWASPHAPEERKAAYRFHDESLVGGPVIVRKPGFVAYQEA